MVMDIVFLYLRLNAIFSLFDHSSFSSVSVGFYGGGLHLNFDLTCIAVVFG